MKKGRPVSRRPFSCATGWPDLEVHAAHAAHAAGHAGGAGLSSGFSLIAASVVISRPATEAAS
jgi:hypothetical protein